MDFGLRTGSQQKGETTMEIIESRVGDEVAEVTNQSIPRGGPIYVSNFVSSPTRVPEFETAVLHALQDLEAELSIDSSTQSCNDEDISVDELKIFTEEELVEMALKEAFKDEKNGDSDQLSEEQSNAGRKDYLRLCDNKDACLDFSERGEDTSTSLELSNGSHSRTNSAGNTTNKKSRKRKKRNTKALAADESYLARVDELAKIKQKQDEEKAQVKLHSFNYKFNESMVPSSEGIGSMKSLRSLNYKKRLLKSSDVQEYVALRYPEIVLCVEVYHNIRKELKIQEFLVLGRQTLTELRDKIHCLTDKVMQKAKQRDPSGYFLIEDVFFNDLRDPAAIDYSEPILDWVRNSKDEALKKWEYIISGNLRQKQKAVVGELPTTNFPNFRRADMQKTRFCDLRFRLGAQYLYCHQGDCKHTVVIRDMRLIHPEDVQNRAAYPIVIFQLKSLAQKCKVCKIYRAKKITVDDKWAPSNPCYFCDDCYYLLHHNEDGSLLYSDFSVYEYMHD